MEFGDIDLFGDLESSTKKKSQRAASAASGAGGGGASPALPMQVETANKRVVFPNSDVATPTTPAVPAARTESKTTGSGEIVISSDDDDDSKSKPAAKTKAAAVAMEDGEAGSSSDSDGDVVSIAPPAASAPSMSLGGGSALDRAKTFLSYIDANKPPPPTAAAAPAPAPAPTTAPAPVPPVPTAASAAPTSSAAAAAAGARTASVATAPVPTTNLSTSAASRLVQSRLASIQKKAEEKMRADYAERPLIIIDDVNAPTPAQLAKAAREAEVAAEAVKAMKALEKQQRAKAREAKVQARELARVTREQKKAAREQNREDGEASGSDMDVETFLDEVLDSEGDASEPDTPKKPSAPITTATATATAITTTASGPSNAPASAPPTATSAVTTSTGAGSTNDADSGEGATKRRRVEATTAASNGASSAAIAVHVPETDRPELKSTLLEEKIKQPSAKAHHEVVMTVRSIMESEQREKRRADPSDMQTTDQPAGAPTEEEEREAYRWGRNRRAELMEGLSGGYAVEIGLDKAGVESESVKKTPKDRERERAQQSEELWKASGLSDDDPIIPRAAAVNTTASTGLAAATSLSTATTPAPAQQQQRRFATELEELAFLRSENERLRRDLSALNPFGVVVPTQTAFGLASNAQPKAQK